MGYRTNAQTADLSQVLPEDIEAQVKEASDISMGTEVPQVAITVVMTVSQSPTRRSARRIC